MIAKRLHIYIKHLNLSLYAFENSVDASRGSISKAIRDNKSLGSNVLLRIFEKYPLNPVWLFLEKNPMELENNHTEAIIPLENEFNDLKIDDKLNQLYSQNKSMLKTLALLDTIQLKQDIENKIKELERSKNSAKKMEAED